MQCRTWTNSHLLHKRKQHILSRVTCVMSSRSRNYNLSIRFPRSPPSQSIPGAIYCMCLAAQTVGLLCAGTGRLKRRPSGLTKEQLLECSWIFSWSVGLLCCREDIDMLLSGSFLFVCLVEVLSAFCAAPVFSSGCLSLE